MANGLSVVILAAGNGKRMISKMAKVMHPIGGVPMLERVVNTACTLNPDNIFVVYGNGGSQVAEDLNYLPVTWVDQRKQLGTGHAVLQALPQCKDHQVLVLYGDVPLISQNTLQQLLAETPHHGLGLVVTELEDPAGFGRIIRNDVGNIVAIVEHKDADENQLKINEINTGILTSTAEHLNTWLPKLKNKNTQNEYYLTDVVAMAVEDGVPVGGVMAHCHQEVQGVNDRWQQCQLERYFQMTQVKQLILSGVTVMDPQRLDMRGDITVGVDTLIGINVVLEGTVKIGTGCIIGANTVLKDVVIGDGVTIKPNTVITGSTIAQGASIGPFTHIRPDSMIDRDAKVGNFVEIKKSHLGVGSKAGHLSYLGDAVIGKNVNIGAGTITCNYDGVNKFATHIQDDSFIGSNTSLVAPVTVGAKATIGAGSVICKDAPPKQLTLTRSDQLSVKDWSPKTVDDEVKV